MVTTYILEHITAHMWNRHLPFSPFVTHSLVYKTPNSFENHAAVCSLPPSTPLHNLKIWLQITRTLSIPPVIIRNYIYLNVPVEITSGIFTSNDLLFCTSLSHTMISPSLPDHNSCISISFPLVPDLIFF